MNIKEYLSERIFLILLNIGVLFLIDFILYICKINLNVIIIISVLYFISIFSIYFYEYVKRKSFLQNLHDSINSLDEKYLLSEILTDPSQCEFKDYIDILRQCNKSMNDKINSIDLRENEFREYIELWVHEVKTPISSAKLTIENNKNSVTESIEEDIRKVEYYIEQALFYARSGNVEKDFLIKKVNLERLVNTSIKKYSKLLIKHKVKIVKKNLNMYVYSDDKWIEFIIEQIISNSVKYFDKEEKILEFIAMEDNEAVRLIIKDNGIGIEKKYLKRIFEKGFTGDNGRNIKEATGIGLYLCRKLCNKLNLNIDVKSKYREGTCMIITFPKSSQYFLM